MTGLPTPTTGTEMYLAAILDELKRIEVKLDALQPKPAPLTGNNVELVEQAKAEIKAAESRKGKR